MPTTPDLKTSLILASLIVGVAAPIVTHFSEGGAHEQMTRDLVTRIEKDEADIVSLQHTMEKERNTQQAINEDMKVNFQKVFDGLETIKASIENMARKSK